MLINRVTRPHSAPLQLPEVMRWSDDETWLLLFWDLCSGHRRGDFWVWNISISDGAYLPLPKLAWPPHPTPKNRWVEESRTPCSLCGALHSAASRRSDTEDPLCHYYHAAWSRETLFQNGGLIFSRTIREWLKNRHQTGLIKNRRRLHYCSPVHTKHTSLFGMIK